MRITLEEAIENHILISAPYPANEENIEKIIQFTSLYFPEYTLNLLTDTLISSKLHSFSLYHTPEHLKQWMQDTLPSGKQGKQCIVVLGQAQHVHRMRNYLQKSAQTTIMEMNLNAVAYNLNSFRKKLKPDTRVLGMVKAESYGHGKPIMARFLEHSGIDYLAVAITDEGVTLRQSGVQQKLMVMVPHPDSFYRIIRYKLEPVLFSFEILNALVLFLKENKIDQYPVHIKLDTGMHRAGFQEQDIDALINQLAAEPTLHIQSIFSHLASSDEPLHDDYSKQQFTQFTSQANRIREALPYSPFLHIANTFSALRLTELQLDMVRLGIGLYDHSAMAAADLQPVTTLRTQITQIKEIQTGQTVGYNRRWTAKRPTKLATIPVGYGDGLNRMLSNEQGVVSVHGQMVPIIGNICMDYCMLDITGINAAPHDEVLILGDTANTAAQTAKKLHTIAYEVLTGISGRVKRVYTYDLDA